MTFEAEQLGESGTELASLLRDLRKRAGLSGDRLAARCNMSQSKVSRIENGRTRPSLVDVEQILRALDAPPGLVAEVSALARMANTEWRNLPPRSNAQDLWIDLGLARGGRTFPNDPVMVIE